MNILSARTTIEGKTETIRVRDAFIDLDLEAKKTLRLGKVDYVEKDGQLIVLGDSALNMANLFKREVRRPLQRGVVSAGELEAQQILSLLVYNVLKEPTVANEHCFYSVPASPIDDPEQDIVYHQEVFKKIIQEHGYTPHPMNESMAIIYSQCAPENFSGLAVSFGSGMMNCALAYQTVKGVEFSLARCLSDDFPVVTDTGLKMMKDIVPGDMVLDATGTFVSVEEKLDNGYRDSLLEVELEHLNSLPHRLTSDHRVFVSRRFGWEWVQAGDLKEGDMCGVPTIQSSQTSGGTYYFGRKNGDNITVATARNLGRFFGLFLGDGSCGPYAVDPEFVQIAIDIKDRKTIDKTCTVLATIFGGFGVQLVEDPAEGVCRIKLHSTVISRHMKERFYTKDGEKTVPLPIDRISDQMALGIIEGLLDSDGHEEPKRRCITNTSLPVVMLTHHLLNRFGVEHSIQKRLPRQGGVNKRGVRIEGKKDTYEIRVTGHVAVAVLDMMLKVEGHSVHDNRPCFATYKVQSIKIVPYGRSVWDIRVGSDHHSFSSPGMVVHNCGDWIDSHAAKALGSTAARVCSAKERGIDLMTSGNREAEAISLYIRALIRYCLENIAVQFRRIQSTLSLPDPIPFVLSGGTTKAINFEAVFKEEFEQVKKKGFPIPISEVRMAKDPMTAVAEGLLVLAGEEYAG
jgi:hypothetical protein